MLRLPFRITMRSRLSGKFVCRRGSWRRIADDNPLEQYELSHRSLENGGFVTDPSFVVEW